jgi:hypothetical protein
VSEPGSRTGRDSPAKDDRASRLADRLRANLQRRKAQARARRADTADDRRDADQEAGPHATDEEGRR